MARQQRAYPAETRERARKLRRAGFSYSEIIEQMDDDIPLTTLQAWVSDIQLTIEQQERIGRRQYPYPPEVRRRARELRQAGLTYSEIVAALGFAVPQGTLSSWLSDIELTPEQRARIKQKEIEGARQSQYLGAEWNREQKQKRIQEAKEKAAPLVKQLVQDNNALMLMAAALYIGEGAKTESAFSFSNSNPQVIRAWVALLRRCFDIDERKFACQLAISVDMDEENLRRYWSEITGIPLSQFIASSVKRNPGKKRREGYKGVCVVLYYSLAIRRFLDALGQGVMGELLTNE